MKQLEKTPKGEALWLKMIRPETNYNPQGVYEGNLVLKGKEAEEFKSIVDQYITDAVVEHTVDGKKPKKANPPYKVNEVDGQEDGIAFKFKMKAKYETRKGDVITQKPTVVDAKGIVITDPEFSIGNGSIVKIAYKTRTWSVAGTGCGVSLIPMAVQVINHVPYSANSDGFGFEEEEGFEFKEGEKETIFEEEDDF